MKYLRLAVRACRGCGFVSQIFIPLDHHGQLFPCRKSSFVQIPSSNEYLEEVIDAAYTIDVSKGMDQPQPYPYFKP